MSKYAIIDTETERIVEILDSCLWAYMRSTDKNAGELDGRYRFGILKSGVNTSDKVVLVKGFIENKRG